MKSMFGSSLPPVVCRWRMSCLCYLCLFAYSGVQHILCYVFAIVFHVYPMFPVFPDCPSLIALSLFSNVSLLQMRCM
jgi:hypothetical protein